MKKIALISVLVPFIVSAELGPDTMKDDIPGTATIKQIVDASGNPQGMTTNAVRNIVEGYGYETVTNAASTYQPKGQYLSIESDPTVGLTNDTVYASGTNRTFLTEHQDIPLTAITTNGVMVVLSNKTAHIVIPTPPEVSYPVTDIQTNGASVLEGTVAKLNGLASTNYVNDAIAGIVIPTGDRITDTNGLSTIYADGTWITRTNATAGVSETNLLCTVDSASAMTNDATIVRWYSSGPDGEKLRHGDTVVSASDVGALPAQISSSSYYVGDGYGVLFQNGIEVNGYNNSTPGLDVEWQGSDINMLWGPSWGGHKWYYNGMTDESELAVKGDLNDYRLKTDNNMYEEIATASYTTARQYRVVGKIATISGDSLNSMICDAKTNTAFDCHCLETNLYAVVSPSVSSNYVQKTIKINNKPLSGDVSLTYTDVNAMSSSTTHLSGDVPVSRTINGKSLTSNISLSSEDIGAQSVEAAEMMRVELANGGVKMTRSETASYYRNGRTGELGYGYAYVVSAGDGHRRFGAHVPRSEFSIELVSVDQDDPIINFYGREYSHDDLSRSVTSIGYDEYETPGSYNEVCFSEYWTNGLPFTAYVRNYYGTISLSGVGTTGTSYLSITDPETSTEHYLSQFSADTYNSTISYYDQWYNTSTFNSGATNRTLHVVLTSHYSGGNEFVMFGDSGSYSTPSEVDDRVGLYIQGHPIQRTVLKERTGKEYELGDGWGYMVYDWTSDMRSWQIKIPSLVPTPSYTATRLSGTQTYGTFVYPSNPIMDIGFICGTIVERVKSTHDKQGSDGVRTANAYIQGWGFTNSNGVVYSQLLRVDADNLVYGSPDYLSTYSMDSSLTNVVYSFDWGCNGTGYSASRSNAYHCVMSNFRATNSGLTYDNVITWNQYENGSVTRSGTFTTYPFCGFTLTRNVNALRAVTTPVVKIATIATSHYYWDPGLKCTWQLVVTNGCFFAEKVSDEDLTRKD